MKPPSEEALAEHRRACRKQDAGYFDPDTNLFVMTSFYLLERAGCCGSGCRHCPFSVTQQQAAGRPDVPSWPFDWD